uniref:Uncharacterized protein n=1 Tax=Sphaerodactylus townsendi TaxID=933632 RepID=A0ACB8E6X4_9SAUR
MATRGKTNSVSSMKVNNPSEAKTPGKNTDISQRLEQLFELTQRTNQEIKEIKKDISQIRKIETLIQQLTTKVKNNTDRITDVEDKVDNWQKLYEDQADQMALLELINPGNSAAHQLAGSENINNYSQMNNLL